MISPLSYDAVMAKPVPLLKKNLPVTFISLKFFGKVEVYMDKSSISPGLVQD